MRLGITEHIDCAHYLPDHPKCGRLHGHTYKVELVIAGENTSGMILDFGVMKKILREIVYEYDHRSWNEFLDYPSVENICELIHRRIGERLSFSYTVRVWEGVGKWAEKS